MIHRIHTITLFLLAGLSGLLLVSASGKASAEIIGSCNNATGGICVEYTGAGYKDIKSLQRVCEAQTVTFLVGSACPTEERVGTCVRNRGKPTETQYRYYSNFPGTGPKVSKKGVAAQGQRQCKPPKGEWILN